MGYTRGIIIVGMKSREEGESTTRWEVQHKVYFLTRFVDMSSRHFAECKAEI